MDELAGIIRAEIVQKGPIRFDRFMELALYHPDFGYYRRERETARTGREGDFFTSVSVGPLFGRLLARQFFQMWNALEKPVPFRLIEQGAEDGQLACDILQWCRDETPEFFAAIRYAVIEASLAVRERLQKKIEVSGLLEKVTWFGKAAELAGQDPVGVFFSNELVDAFPVRRITRQEGRWLELYVADESAKGFAWVKREIRDPELADAIKARSLPEIEGYATEIHLRAAEWMREVAGILRRGYILTSDYGFPAAVYYAPFRVGGTLTAYREHRRMEEVLAEPGDRDITAHVDFTALMRSGEKAGWKTLGFLDQQHFLMGIAHDELSGATGPVVGIAGKVRAWQTLIHPAHLGSRFHALVQARNAPGDLDCLRYAPAEASK